METRDPALETRLTEHLRGARLGQPLYAFQRVGSTMEIAHALVASGAPEGALVFAARQNRGRGRLGRAWNSPEGGVYLSLVLRPSRPPADTPQLSLVAGLATVQAIQQLTGAFPVIRWPNDVFVSDRKVAGILVEARAAVVVGIGINVATDPGQLPKQAGSLAALGASADPYRLTGAFCRQVASWYDVWAREGFGPIRNALRPWMGLFGRPVHITAGTHRFEGTAQDLDGQGRLVVRLDSGMQRAFEVGEVALLR